MQIGNWSEIVDYIIIQYAVLAWLELLMSVKTIKFIWFILILSVTQNLHCQLSSPPTYFIQSWSWKNLFNPEFLHTFYSVLTIAKNVLNHTYNWGWRWWNREGKVVINIFKTVWPNGKGTSFRSWGLQVRVLSRLENIFYIINTYLFQGKNTRNMYIHS